MPECRFTEKANLESNCVRPLCRKQTCSPGSLACSESGVCTLRARCDRTQTMTLNRHLLTPNVLCTHNNFLEFSCTNELGFGCDPHYLKGHIEFEVKEPGDCETIVRQESYNWDLMACTCSSCNCRHCDRRRIYCNCSVETIRLLSTSDKWNETMATDGKFFNTTGYYTTSTQQQSTMTVHGTTDADPGYSTSSNGQSIVKPATSEQTNTIMIIGITTGLVLLCILVLLAVIFICRKRANKNKSKISFVNKRVSCEIPGTPNQDRQEKSKTATLVIGNKSQSVPMTDFNVVNHIKGDQDIHLYNIISEETSSVSIDNSDDKPGISTTEPNDPGMYNVLNEKQTVNDCGDDMYSHVRQDHSTGDEQYDELSAMKKKSLEDVDDLYDHNKITTFSDTKHPNDDDYDHVKNIVEN